MSDGQCIHTFEIRYKLCRVCAGHDTKCRCYEPRREAKAKTEESTHELHKHAP